MPRLQVAIDTVDLPLAIQQAKAAGAAGAPIVEAGTLLIKSQGLRAISLLREAAPAARLVADLKTMDMGDLEVSAALTAGADEAVVCAAAPDETIVSAAKEASDRGATLLVSLIGLSGDIARARQVTRLAEDAVLIAHFGNDEDVDWGEKSAVEQLQRLLDAVDNPVAVGGNVRLDTVQNLAGLNLDRVIVGRALARPANFQSATEAFIKLLDI